MKHPNHYHLPIAHAVAIDLLCSLSDLNAEQRTRLHWAIDLLERIPSHGLPEKVLSERDALYQMTHRNHPRAREYWPFTNVYFFIRGMHWQSRRLFTHRLINFCVSICMEYTRYCDATAKVRQRPLTLEDALS